MPNTVESHHDLYLKGKHHKGYQPTEDVFPDNLHSWEVYGSLTNGMEAHPEIPREKWLEFDFSDDNEPIEDPQFID
ncbi:hypothetical protein J8A87_22905 [Vibrio parahaemolyticus]|uniref:hypothetical protein n=1 Tax=Vibrio sp. 2092 TaxID=3074593 RepID=UPI00118F3658|nr:hypothetical protein [Vibrio sp. 2092]MCA2471240.1 hypothetical protein [Vibrio alginolyticus]MCF9167302.1 hypothetical protein [Vibrio parahaemolyticus]MDW2151260.1 hypothetical protein [Vibrio sp. 2092]TVN05473.1 hypothetical protein FPV63_09090 [Vibrio cholerae]